MNNIPEFWKDGPHQPIEVETHWRDFVRSIGGIVVEDVVSEPRQFENADFAFLKNSIIVELKEIKTEFSKAPAFKDGYDKLMTKLLTEQPNWKPLMFGGDEKYPYWFVPEFVRIFRPPISRILKKANRQIRDTKTHFGISSPTGILLLVNDGFTSIGPDIIKAQISDLLAYSYSSIDCCIYVTVNRYVEIMGSDEPKLLWAPTYSDRASDNLVEFVDDLGRKWFNYLESNIGNFTSRSEYYQDSKILHGSKAVTLPYE